MIEKQVIEWISQEGSGLNSLSFARTAGIGVGEMLHDFELEILHMFKAFAKAIGDWIDEIIYSISVALEDHIDKLD